MSGETAARGGVPYGWVVGGKWFAKCMECGGVVRVDKPLLGSLHLCIADDSGGDAR